MAEVWKTIEGFEGFFEISSLGRVRSMRRTVEIYGGRQREVQERIRSQSHSLKGYRQVHLTGNGIDKVFPVHVLVAAAFLGDRPVSATINHIDCDKDNNAAENLEYCTQLANNIHALQTGLRVNAKGSVNGMAKLTESQVRVILDRLKAGESQTQISKDYGVTNRLIHLIAKRRVWRHVEASTC